MNLLIDGYNLLHASPELAGAESRGQGLEALVTALRLYQKYKRHKLTLVLDGGQTPGGEKTRLAGIPVVYSGSERSADDVLAAMARKGGPGVTVITDDRELASRCAAWGAEVIASREFAPLLMQAAMCGGLEGGGEEDSGEGWDFSTRKKGPSHREPKAKRRRNRRLDRL